MSTSASEMILPVATNVMVSEDILTVELSDGRTVTVPASWYPRLTHANKQERNHWELTGSGRGIHWPAIDEDISVEAILAGKRSNESQTSLQKWLAGRNNIPG